MGPSESRQMRSGTVVEEGTRKIKEDLTDPKKTELWTSLEGGKLFIL